VTNRVIGEALWRKLSLVGAGGARGIKHRPPQPHLPISAPEALEIDEG